MGTGGKEEGESGPTGNRALRVFTAIELIVDVFVDNVVKIAGKIIFVAFEIQILGDVVKPIVPILLTEIELTPQHVVVNAYLS